MVSAEVQDSTSDTTFILFERHILKLINVSAQHILSNDKNANQDVIPVVLNNILGKRYVLKLSLINKNTKENYEGFTVTEVKEIRSEEYVAATSHVIKNPLLPRHMLLIQVRISIRTMQNIQRIMSRINGS